MTFTANHRVGGLTLTSISSFKHFETHNREDEDGTADPRLYLDTENIEKNSSIYQELRAGYDSDLVTGIVGASYFHERGRQTSAVTLLSDSVDNLLGAVADFPIFTILDSVGVPGVFGQQFREDMNNRAANESYAAFGDATFHVTDQLSPDRRHPLHARRQALHLVQRRLRRRRAGGGRARTARCTMPSSARTCSRHNSSARPISFARPSAPPA